MRHLSLMVLLAASTAHAAPIGAVVELDRSIVRVGDAVIWESEVALRVKAGVERAAVIEMMIDDELILAEGTKAGITVERAEAVAALAEIKQQNSLDDTQLDKIIGDAGYTRARYLVELERQLMVLRTKNQLLSQQVKIDDAAIAAELAARGLPATDDNKQTVATELRRSATEKLQVGWLANLRKRAYITRRP